MTLGAVCGGILMKIGRRKALMLTLLLGIFGCALTMNLEFTSLIIGRFIYGFSAGLISSICPRFMEETIPNRLFDSLQPTFCFSQTVGTISAYFLGIILPDDDDFDALVATDRWLVIYAYYPISLFLLTFLAFVFIIKYDSVKFLVVQDKEEEALKAIG